MTPDNLSITFDRQVAGVFNRFLLLCGLAVLAVLADEWRIRNV